MSAGAKAVAGTSAGMPARLDAAARQRTVRWALVAAAYAGFVLSLYLTMVHYRGYVTGCFVVSGCETVQTSRYAVIFGIPVALAGTLFFAVLFYLAIALLTGAWRFAVPAFKVLAFAGALAMIPLFLLQAVVLHAFCSYCLLVEVITLGIWGMSFLLRSPSSGGAQEGSAATGAAHEAQARREAGAAPRPSLTAAPAGSAPAGAAAGAAAGGAQATGGRRTGARPAKRRRRRS